jgi:methyl-accepting chemotaxis protein PixJ
MLNKTNQKKTVVKNKDGRLHRINSGILHQKNNNVTGWLKDRNLRTNATLFTAAISVLPILAIGTTIYYIVNQSITEDVTNTQKQAATELGGDIKDFLQRKKREIELLATQDFLASNRNAYSISQKVSRMNSWQEITSHENVAVFDTNGNIFLQTQQIPITNQLNEEYFQNVLQTNKSIITQSTNVNPENARIFLTAPVKDKITGKTIYIIRSVVPAKQLIQVINSQENQGKYSLADVSGQIFLTTDSRLVQKNAQQVFPDWEQFQAQNQIMTHISNQGSGKPDKLFTYVPWQKTTAIPELKWNLITSTDKAAAFATRKQLLWILVVGLIATVLLSGGIAAILVNRLILRILSANVTLKKIASGNLQTRIPLNGKDEITSLGMNINYMAAQLEELLSQQKDEAEQLKLFTDILLSIRSSNTENLLKTTTIKVRQALGVERVIIYRYSYGGYGTTLAESATNGFASNVGDIIELNVYSKQSVEAHKNTDVIVVHNIYEAGLDSEDLRFLQQLHIKAFLAVPIIVNNQVFGFLVVHDCVETYEWKLHEINFVRQLGLQIGVTLERAKLLEETQALKNLAIHLSNSWNATEIYNLAVQNIRKALKVDRVVIYQFDQEWKGLFLAESVVAGFPCAKGFKLNEPCLVDYVDKYRQGRVLATNDVYKANLSECYLQQLETFSVKANLVAPIIVGEELLGLLIAHQCSQPRDWQKSEVDLFEQFGRLVGLAIQRATLLELMQTQRQTAENLSQQQLQQREHLEEQLATLLQEIEAVIAGDLTVHAQVSAGDIGTVADFFNATVESLRSIVTQVKATANEVNSAIAKNSTAMNELAIASHTQAEEINHTLDSVAQMRTVIKTVAKSARQAKFRTKRASTTATSGSQAMELTVENITNLRDTIEETAKKVKRLGEASQQISYVVSLINQISMQTNLLAINAGIEAARAGKENQGFIVVAEEVAGLATRSATAASEISTIIFTIQRETSQVVNAMELGTEQVGESTRLVEDTKENLQQIVNVCYEIDDLVESISHATVSQVQLSQQVTNAMKQVAQTATMNSTYSQQVSDFLQNTVEISQQLQASVETFKVE